jgi:hypothetical protein
MNKEEKKESRLLCCQLNILETELKFSRMHKNKISFPQGKMTIRIIFYKEM